MFGNPPVGEKRFRRRDLSVPDGPAIGPSPRNEALVSQLFRRHWTGPVPATLVAVSVCFLAAQTKNADLSARDIFLRKPSKDAQRPKPEFGEPEDSKKTAPLSDALGIRYTVFLVKPGLRTAVDPNRTFSSGECFALEIETNRDGYLYVFTEGASGRWDTLHPVGEEPIRPRNVPGRSRLEIPAGECWEFKKPPGDERMFLVLSDTPEDVQKMLNIFRLSELSRGAEQENSPGKAGGSIARVRTSLASRDIARKQMGSEPMEKGEDPFTVYSVASPPRLFFEITLRHR